MSGGADADRTLAPWHIWLVTDAYPPLAGGSGWSTHALARTLRERGHRIEVIVIDSSADHGGSRVFDEVPVTTVGVKHAKRHLGHRLGAHDYSFSVVRAYLDDRLARAGDVDLLHAQHLHSGPPTVAAARRHGVGALVTVRDYWPVCLHGTSWWGGTACPGCSTARLTGCMAEYWHWPRAASRLMVGWARRRLSTRREGILPASVIAVSRAVKERIQPELPDATIEVIHNVVDPVQVEREARGAAGRSQAVPSPYLCAAGKLIPTKGFARLIDALAEADCPWPLVIAGSGPERAALQARARELGLDLRILDWLEHPALLHLVREAHAFLLPSRWAEPLSRLMLESMALGTPVVAWPTGGTPEVLIHRVNGWLVAQPADLAAALNDISGPTTRRRIGEVARRWIDEHCSPDAIYPRIAAVYTEAMARAQMESDRP